MQEVSRLKRDLIKKKFSNVSRNLSHYGLLDCLYVCHAYMTLLQSNSKLPRDIEPPPFEIKPKINLRAKGLCEWRLETLIREALIFAKETSKEKLSVWNNLAFIMNSVGKAHDALYNSKRDIWVTMMLTVAQQHHWQTGISNRLVSRYLRILQHGRVAPHIESVFHCTPDTLVRAAYGLYAHFSYNLDAPEKMGFENINIDPVWGENFLKRITLDQSNLVKRLRKIRTLDEKMVYGVSPFLVNPIFRHAQSGRLLCPIPYYLFKRILEGAYFDCYGENDFGNDYGAAFEDYVFDFLDRIRDSASTHLQRDILYGTRQRPKRSSDILFSTQSSTYFIECKAKKMPMSIRDATATKEEIQKEIGKIVDATVQAYRALYDLEQNRYEVDVEIRDRKFIIILTLEKWHVFGLSLTDFFDNELHSKMNEKGIPVELIDRVPFRILACDEFEFGIYTAIKSGKDQFLDEITGQQRWYDPTSTFFDAFKTEQLKYKNPFADELDSVLVA